ncbi:MAG: peptide-methionine (S)-S-oxide reductase MsrA [Euryarchaeota archaeon]|nr:peptide-methionine (S)-S-oxide reductase MsrA [Euryarchaeota archaeon]
MAKQEMATLGGGCFWCLDAVYEQIRGVEKVVSGYAGGRTDSPSYEDVCNEDTGHAEVVQVTFDPTVVTFRQLLDVFFTMHDPTTLNRQGADVGTQYRSVILYHSAEQKTTAEAAKKEAAQIWDDPIVTEIAPLTRFFPGEEYHQSFFRRNPYQPYCRGVVAPKVAKFRQKWARLLKAEATAPA